MERSDEGEGEGRASWEVIADCRRSAHIAGFVQRSDVESEQVEIARPAVTVLFVLSGAMRLGSDGSVVGAAAVGLRSLPLRSRWSGPIECLEVKLSPLDMFAVSGGRPMNEITEDIVDLDDLLSASKSRLHAQVTSALDWHDRFELVQDLIDEARTTHHGSAEVREAWSTLTATGGRADVRELCSATGWSAKRLRSRFRREIGVTPKQAARLIRFGLAHQRLLAGVSPSVVAAEGGFADQSHLHRDVVSFSGTTPGRLAARPHGL